MNIDVENTRIRKLSEYLVDIVNELIDKEVKINANMLSKNIYNYSLDKIPTASVIEEDITGIRTCRDLFSFRSRNEYSIDEINNLSNIGFYELFEQKIKSNNDEGNLPDITGIISIECLNCGSMVNVNTNTAEFDIQIQITYEEE